MWKYGYDIFFLKSILYDNDTRASIVGAVVDIGVYVAINLVFFSLL